MPAHFGYSKLSAQDLMNRGFSYQETRRMAILRATVLRARLSSSEKYLLFHRYLYLLGAYKNDATPE